MSSSSCCSGGKCTHVQVDLMHQDSLYKYIDHHKSRALNELVEGSIQKVILPFDQKNQKAVICKSEDDDEQMILHIPFSASVKLTSFTLAGDGESCPSKISVWVNRDDIDFDNCQDVKPTHVFDIAKDPKAELQYPADPLKFQNIHSLTFWIEENHGGSQTAFTFLGFRGTFLAPRVGVVVATYESRPQLADHKAPDELKTTMGL